MSVAAPYVSRTLRTRRLGRFGIDAGNARHVCCPDDVRCRWLRRAFIGCVFEHEIGCRSRIPQRAEDQISRPLRGRFSLAVSD